MQMTDHKPDRWRVVDAGPKSVVLSAMCICGNDDCHYTAVSWHDTWMHISPDAVCQHCGGPNH